MKSTTIVLLIATALLVPFMPAAAADADSVRTKFGYDNQVLETIAATPEERASAAEDANFFRYRMEQQRNAPIYAGMLAITAIIAHLATLTFLARIGGGATYVVSVTGLIYVVFGTILLVVIANTEAQLTAAMGILGAVAGYVFGKARREPGDAAKPVATRVRVPETSG